MDRRLPKRILEEILVDAREYEDRAVALYVGNEPCDIDRLYLRASTGETVEPKPLSLAFGSTALADLRALCMPQYRRGHYHMSALAMLRSEAYQQVRAQLHGICLRRPSDFEKACEARILCGDNYSIVYRRRPAICILRIVKTEAIPKT